MAHNRQGGTILVVDDNADIQGFAKIFLEKAGYAVVTASDGEEGIRVYQEHRSSIILMLTDIAMPKIGGLELADRVLEMDSQLAFSSCPVTPGAITEAWNVWRSPFAPPS